MSVHLFDSEMVARWHAQQHYLTDPGVIAIHFLPGEAPEREIRLLEVNNLMVDTLDDFLEPIDFGVDRGLDTEHRLNVLDISPRQWELLKKGELSLPAGWSLKSSIEFDPPQIPSRGENGDE